MSRLTELRNEEAAAMLAELIEPASVIFADKEIRDALKESKMSGVKCAMKKHGKELIDLLAIIDGADRETYSVNAMQIVTKTLAILSDKELIQAFTSQAQTAES